MRNFLEFNHCMKKKEKITAIKTHLSQKLQSYCFPLDSNPERCIQLRKDRALCVWTVVSFKINLLMGGRGA